MQQIELESTIGFSGLVPKGLIAHPGREHIIYPLGCTVIIERISGKKNQQFLHGLNSNISCLAVSTSGRYVAAGQETHIGFGADIIIWDFNTQKLLHRLSIHKEKVQGLTFSPNDKFLASLGGHEDNSSLVWDVQTGQAVCGSSASQKPASGFTEIIVFANTSDHLFMTAGEQILRVWEINPATRKLIVTEVVMGTVRRHIKAVVISPDDQLAYCGTTTGDVLQVSIPNKLFKTSGPEKAKFSQGVISLAQLKTGDLVVGAGNGEIAVIKPGVWKPTKSAKLDSSVTSIAIRGDGHEIFAGTARSIIYRVGLAEFKPEQRLVAHYERVNQVEFAPGSSELFVTCSINDIRVWHAPTGKQLLLVSVPNQECHSVTFSSDGKLIYSGWNDCKIRGFLPQSGKLKFEINNVHTKGVTAVAVVNDGSRIISGGGDGQVRVWRIGSESQSLIETMKEHKARVTSIKVKKNGTECVSSSTDGTCIIWDLARFVRRQIVFANTLFSQVSYRPDESQIITAGSDKKISAWELFDGTLIREVEGSVGPIHGLDVSPDGKYFVSGGDDKLLKVWKYNEGEATHTGGGHSGAITCVKISPDQRTIISVGSDGGIFRWAFPK